MKIDPVAQNLIKKLSTKVSAMHVTTSDADIAAATLTGVMVCINLLIDIIEAMEAIKE